ncbi:MAG: arsenate reductase ArsC [Pseudohongiella sp.]|nr:arsenate reductase ArsC [Pseudohongiella sp.]
MKRVLFLCVSNSARSQMAEGWARHLLPGKVDAYSAGSRQGTLNPLAIQSMLEIGIDISEHQTKSIDTLDLQSFDLVVTLCEEEICPKLPPSVMQMHWPLPGPSKPLPNDDSTSPLERFSDTRDQIRELIERLACFLELDDRQGPQ